MSCTRQNYDNGNDIASAIENGKQCDFSKEMPTMTTPTPPDAKQVEDKPELQQEHDDKAQALELRLKVQMQAFVKREETCDENVAKAHALLMQQCAEQHEARAPRISAGLHTWVQKCPRRYENQKRRFSSI